MLSGPMEILELKSGEPFLFRVTEWQRDEAIIRPARAPMGIAVDVLRLHVPAADKPLPPHYWDLTAKTAIFQLLPHLQRPDFKNRTFTLTARGDGPAKRFELEVK